MKNAYTRVFSQVPGAARFSAAAVIGRIALGMSGLAVILTVSELMNSYATAGLVAGAASIGMAVFAPLRGRLVDRFGQAAILYLFAALNVIGTLLLLATIKFAAPVELMCAAGFLFGASLLSTAGMVRTRWSHAIRSQGRDDQEAMLQVAYAFEAIVDEVVFISAPLLATFLCISVHPLAGLTVGLVIQLVGSIALAVQRTTQPPVSPAVAKNASPLGIPGFVMVVAAIFFVGIGAGAIEVIVVARSAEAGSKHLAGLLMGALSLSSMLAGLWYGAQSFSVPVRSLWVRCLGLLVLALVPLSFAQGLPFVAAALFLIGFGIGPASIAGQVLTERMLSGKQMNEGMSLVGTAMALGMGGGNWGAGLLFDKLGGYSANALPLAATFLGLLLAARIRERTTT